LEQASFSNITAEVEAYSMLEDVGMASGHIKAGFQSKEHMDAKDCPWATALDKTYKNKRVVGSGATACVYLAENADAQTVAIKVGKGGSGESLSAWNEECKSMQLLRVDACKSSKRGNTGPLLYDLNAMYIPTCMEVGSVEEEGKEVNFYVMHAAGTEELRNMGSGYSDEDRKSLFAQLVGAVYALHGLDTGHNDLHGGNILISKKTGKPRLALIDFGELSTPLDPTTPVIPPSTTWLFDYKRDGNAVMAWTSHILNCPAIPEFPVVPGGSELRERGEEFKACLKKWGAGDDTIKAMDIIVDKNSRQFPTQSIEGLFQSSFVQKHLPKMEQTYTWDKTKGCTNWDITKIVEFRREVEFSAMYKCETVPTYNKITWKTRKDGKKVKKTSQQCVFQRSACYTLIPGVTWACDAGTIKGSPCDSVSLSRKSGHSDKVFDGGCLNVNHEEGYKYAKTYPGYEPPKVDPNAARRRRTWTPMVTPKPKTVTEPPFDLATLKPECKCSQTGIIRGKDTRKKGCKTHLSRSYGPFCYIDGDSSCPGNPSESKSNTGAFFRKCYPLHED
jgi:serine/threonine protein kinase